jgi:hypothetical protein
MADDDREEADEDVLDALEGLSEAASDLKEAVGQHPDPAVEAMLGAEVAKLEEIIARMQGALPKR